MIEARMGTGWQTLMTDLSIILFMITAAALGQQQPATAGRKDGDGAAQTPSQRSEPVAVYRAVAGAPPLGDWLASQPRDPRQMLTIVSTYTDGRENPALELAAKLAHEAHGLDQTTRVVIEPGEGGATATLGYDSNLVLARSLQRRGEQNPKGDNR